MAQPPLLNIARNKLHPTNNEVPITIQNNYTSNIVDKKCISTKMSYADYFNDVFNTEGDGFKQRQRNKSNENAMNKTSMEKETNSKTETTIVDLKDYSINKSRMSFF